MILINKPADTEANKIYEEVVKLGLNKFDQAVKQKFEH